MALAGPERSYLLTLGGEDWQTVRGRVYRWRYRMRQTYPGWVDCFHVEPNPSGSGEHHVHGLQHGSGKVSVDVLRAAAEREGFGSWVGIKRVQSAESASFYGVKLAALAASAYSVKGVGEDLETFLDANGGRMVHASRGFWREPGPTGWVDVPGARVARAIASVRAAGEDGWCEATGRPHAWAGAWVG